MIFANEMIKIDPSTIKLVSDQTDKPGSDPWCVKYWLVARTSNSKHTRRNYRREALRWLLFLEIKYPEVAAQNQSLLAHATYEDANEYMVWMSSSPSIPAHLANKYKTKTFTNPDKTYAIRVLHGFYEEMQSAMIGKPPAPAMAMNPFRPFRRIKIQNEQKPQKPKRKALSNEAWFLVWDTACLAPSPEANALQRKLMARDRLVLAFLRGTWERRSTIGLLTWADLEFDTRAELWRIRSKRKGQDFDWHVMPAELFEEIKLFRQAVGLPVTVGAEEKGRSIFWVSNLQSGPHRMNDETAGEFLVYRSVKNVIAKAAQIAEDNGNTTIAEELRQHGVGPHTIRHTMATIWMASGGDARRAQEILGHSSLAVTTGVYDTRHEREVAAALTANWGMTSGHNTQQHVSH